jgi:serine/threonine-protein kinase
MRLGHYEVQGELGRGGMGTVYRAQGPDGAVVAVKLLARTAGGGAAVARFERERRLHLELGLTQGFVPFLEAGDAREGPFLVMPLVPGGTLRDRLHRGPLAPGETIALGRAIASALGRAHALGIVHRDVKPENILFTAEGEPLVADLGLAKHFDLSAPGASQSVALSIQGDFRGTAGYMAPEQMADAATAAAAADVFALGAILYECLAGSPAFTGESLPELLVHVASGTREPLARACDAPPALVAAIEKALAADPRHRFPDGAAFAAALAAGPARAPRRALPVIALGASLALGLALATARPGPLPVLSLDLPAEVDGEAPSAEVAVRATGPLATLRVNGVERIDRASEGPWRLSLPVPEDGLAVVVEATDPRGRAVVPRSGTVRRKPRTGFSGERLPRGMRRGAASPVCLWDTGRGFEIETVYVPPGPFAMGSDLEAPDAEGPAHRHAMPRGYWIGRSPTTWGQFLAFCRETGHAEPPRPSFWGKLPDPLMEHPVVEVTWHDALAFCEWVGMDLPTEAQWEKAARGGDDRRWPWGNTWDGTLLDSCDVLCPPETTWGTANVVEQGWRDAETNDGFAYTAPVGSYPRGASPFGMLDAAGNVWQWSRDVFDATAYARYLAGGAPATLGELRTRRGGGWSSPRLHCRTHSRGPFPQDLHLTDTGFRPVLSE